MNIYYIKANGKACHVEASNTAVAIKRGVDYLGEDKSSPLTVYAEVIAKNTTMKQWRQRKSEAPNG